MSDSESSMERQARPAQSQHSWLKSVIHRVATPFVTGLFIVSMISGVALFLHTGQALFHEMHEWLSIVLLAPFGMHLWKNWPSLMGYFKRRAMMTPLALSLAVALPFAFAGLVDGGGQNPAFATVNLMTQAHISDLAPVLKSTPEMVLNSLRQRGYSVQSADLTLDDVAASSGKSAGEILFSLMSVQ